MTSSAANPFSRNWLMGFRADLIWIILSAGIGWAYLALVLGVGAGLDNPLRDAFATLRVGDFALPLSLGLVVVTSWAVLLDAPHLFATLARTVLDPEEWRLRGGVLLASFGFFLLGPALILAPRLLSSAGVLPSGWEAAGSVAFLVFFRLWAYYHVVRQHWGFLRLYARRNPAAEDEFEFRVDRIVFPIVFYLPIGWFLTAPWYGQSGMPELGFATEIGGRALGSWLHLPLGSLWLLAVIGYAAFQWRRTLQASREISPNCCSWRPPCRSTPRRFRTRFSSSSWCRWSPPATTSSTTGSSGTTRSAATVPDTAPRPCRSVVRRSTSRSGWCSPSSLTGDPWSTR